MNISANVWDWVAAGCILCIWSFLYKENPVYRAAEHVFVGSTAGHAIGLAVGNILRYALRPLTQQNQITLIIPIVLGIMLYTRYFRSINWMARWPIAFLLGVGTGQTIYTALRTQVINQSISAMVQLPGATPGITINSLISIVGLLAVLSYFLFTIPQNRALRGASQVGRWLMMVTFGVSFGNVVAGRISVLLGELTRIFGNWLGMM
jgi:hypothetical protein